MPHTAATAEHSKNSGNPDLGALRAILTCAVTIYVYPGYTEKRFFGHSKKIPGIHFSIAANDSCNNDELIWLGSLILNSNHHHRFFPVIKKNNKLTNLWQNSLEQYQNLIAFFQKGDKPNNATYSSNDVIEFCNNVGRLLSDPNNINLPSEINNTFSFVKLTVVSGAPWEYGCNPSDPYPFNRRITTPNIKESRDRDNYGTHICLAALNALSTIVNKKQK
jgi:hypothetical protein